MKRKSLSVILPFLLLPIKGRDGKRNKNNHFIYIAFYQVNEKAQQDHVILNVMLIS